MTYTIAYDEILYACIPDGSDIEPELRIAEEQGRVEIDRRRLHIVTGVTLTDEEPADEDCIVWRGHDLGWLSDEHGVAYKYAVRASGTGERLTYAQLNYRHKTGRRFGPLVPQPDGSIL